jgi:hypothetical protein
MKLTRRAILAGLMATPAAASAAGFHWRHGHGTVLLYDEALPQGRAFAEAGKAWNRTVLPLTGDRIRFAREIFARRPAIVRGLSRQSDAVLLAEVAQEAGYEQVALKVDGVALDWTFAPKIRG